MESWNVKINSEQEDRETERHLSCAWNMKSERFVTKTRRNVKTTMEILSKKQFLSYHG